MTVYFAVPSAPTKLSDTDYVIEKPTFIEEINKSKNKRGVSKLTTASSLRDIFMTITDKYDNTVNPYHLKLNKYEGIKYENDEDLIPIIYRVIDDNDLKLIEAALDHKIKNRPHTVETIYYVTDNMKNVSVFTKNGISPGKQDKKGKETKNSETVV